MTRLTHLDPQGRARMVDVSAKEETPRTARATASLICAATLEQVRADTSPKGAVIATAELAGIMGAKRTADLIPLCHPRPLTKVMGTIEIDDFLPGFRVEVEARTRGRTRVELEALTGATIACLTLSDMLKAIDRSMRIGEIRVMAKSGGASGDWTSEGERT